MLISVIYLSSFLSSNIWHSPPFHPIGENITKEPFLEQTSKLREWYQGPTLWEVMSSHEEPPRKSLRTNLRMTVRKFFNSTDSGIILIGRILTGILRVGDRVILTPSFQGISEEDELIVVSIGKTHQHIERAIPGDIGIPIAMTTNTPSN